jgi:hypothetical protein
MKSERGAHHGGMIERESGLHENARPPAVGEATLPLRVRELHRRGDEIISPRGERDPFGRLKNRRGMDERGDHKPVPIGENLVVKAGADTPFPRFKQLLPHGC